MKGLLNGIRSCMKTPCPGWATETVGFTDASQARMPVRWGEKAGGQKEGKAYATRVYPQAQGDSVNGAGSSAASLYVELDVRRSWRLVGVLSTDSAERRILGLAQRGCG